MEIFNSSHGLTPHARRAFTSAPKRVDLLPGEQLYRFASIVSPTFDGSRIFDSPWWIPQSTFHTIAKTANRTRRSINEVARAGLAVSIPWNPEMDWLMVVELKRAVQAWIGPTKPQPLIPGEPSVMLIGNYDQAYVPGLGPKDAMSSDAAALMFFGSV